MLNRPPFDKARSWSPDANFGSGSSREQAVWALADFGIRCVIAPSFGEIFFANCFKNGVLPIVAGRRTSTPKSWSAAQSRRRLVVDLEAQTVTLPDGPDLAFEIDPYRRRALLLGPGRDRRVSLPTMRPISRRSRQRSGAVRPGCSSTTAGSTGCSRTRRSDDDERRRPGTATTSGAFGKRIGFGKTPALIMIDFVEAYFDKACALYAGVEDALASAIRVAGGGAQGRTSRSSTPTSSTTSRRSTAAASTRSR